MFVQWLWIQLWVPVHDKTSECLSGESFCSSKPSWNLFAEGPGAVQRLHLILQLLGSGVRRESDKTRQSLKSENAEEWGRHESWPISWSGSGTGEGPEWQRIYFNVTDKSLGKMSRPVAGRPRYLMSVTPSPFRWKRCCRTLRRLVLEFTQINLLLMRSDDGAKPSPTCPPRLCWDHESPCRRLQAFALDH